MRGQEAKVVAVPRAENTEAVRAVEAWIELAGIAPSEPLRSITKGGEIGGRLHSQSVSKIIKARIGEHLEVQGVPEVKAKVEGAKYSGHSLRVARS